jgi:hypothetical protein
LFGGSGNDHFDLTSTTGDDTINGGAGNNDVSFEGRTLSDFTSADVVTTAGVTTIAFTDGQTITVSNVKELHFSDGTHNLP